MVEHHLRGLPEEAVDQGVAQLVDQDRDKGRPDPENEIAEERLLVTGSKRLADTPAEQACGQPKPDRHADRNSGERKSQIGGRRLRFGEKHRRIMPPRPSG